MMNKLENFVLPNGVEVVVCPMKGIRMAVMYVGIRGGSSNERVGEVGTLHFLEHVMLEGTEKFPTTSEMDAFSEEYAIRYDGSTSNLHTWFTYSFPDIELGEAIDFAFEIVARPRISRDSIERNRAVILTEQKNYWDDPENDFYREYRGFVLGEKHVYNRRGFGERDVVEAMTRKKLVSTYSKYYNPKNLKVSLVGSVDRGTTDKLLAETFGNWERGGNEICYVKPKNDYAAKLYRYEEGGRKQVSMYIGFPIPGYMELTNEERFELLFFNDLFGDIGSSVLFRRFRDELAMVYTIGSRRVYWPYTGMIEVRVKVDSDNLVKFLDEFVSVVKRLRKNGFAKRDFERVRAFIERMQLIRYSNPYGMCEDYMFRMLDKQELLTIDRMIEYTRDTRYDKVEEWIGKVLDFSKMSVGIMGDRKVVYDPRIEEILKKVGIRYTTN